MTNTTIAFIGAGNIARAIVGGLITGGYPASKIRAADPDEGQRSLMPRGVGTDAEGRAAAAAAEVIVVCVKPDVVVEVLASLGDSAVGKLIVSVAAGITTDVIQAALGSEEAQVVRCMPNTPALVQKGMTGLYATDSVTKAQRELVSRLLGAVGETVWLDAEDQLDAVTALSGSGPAYFFLMMEAMEDAGVSLGLERTLSRKLVLNTALGAASMAIASPEPARTLRENVTSKGGTTAAALDVMFTSGLPETIERAVEKARDRSRAMASASKR